jgi:cytoskeleton protein RodZ
VAIDLKQEREKKKISLAQVASDTRISMRYLEYIEEGRYGDLPGGVYNRAFIKAYCESINLDPREILEHYDRQVSSSIQERNQRTEVLPPSQSTFFIPIPILIWSIMLLISAIGLFFSRAWIADLFAPYFADKPATEAQYSAPPESRTKPGSPASVAPPATASESADTDDIATNILKSGSNRPQRTGHRCCGTAWFRIRRHKTSYGNCRKGFMLDFRRCRRAADKPQINGTWRKTGI